MLDTQKLRTMTRFNLGAFALTFLLFWLNVLLGKAKISYGWDVQFLLSDIAEFLLLLATAIFFTLATISKELSISRDQGSKTNNQN